MSVQRNFPRGLFIAVTSALALMVIAAIVVEQAESSREALPVYGRVPDFAFAECRGGNFGLKDMLGNVCVVDFIFTRCQGPCPIMAEKFRDLYQSYRGIGDVKLVSMTVDPGYDTPQVLHQYASDQGVTDDRWVFLHAPMDDVVRLSEQGFMLPADELPMGHSTRFVLVDRRGQIRGYYCSDDDNCFGALKAQIRRLYHEAS